MGNKVFNLVLTIIIVGVSLFGFLFVRVQARFFSSTCHDSDGGKSYYMKGYVYKAANSPRIGMTRDFYDTCLSQNVLKEYYCASNDDIRSINYTCPGGCQDGSCKSVSPFSGLFKISEILRLIKEKIRILFRIWKS